MELKSADLVPGFINDENIRLAHLDRVLEHGSHGTSQGWRMMVRTRGK